MIQGLQHSKGQVNIKFRNNETGKEVSLSLDDSCKNELPTTMIRSSLCIFKDSAKDSNYEENITSTVFGVDEVYNVGIDDMIKALQAIKE